MAITILKKILRTGTVSEPFARDTGIEQLGHTLHRRLQKNFRGSLAIRQIDAGSCNGCELEIQALNNPYYSVERFGVHFVASPRHADVLLVTGPVSKHMEAALLRAYQATPQPKWVIASGDCARHCGEFADSYAVSGPVSRIIPVDLEIAGCPPSPAQLLQGLLTLLDSAEAAASRIDLNEPTQEILCDDS
jgi:Ni,Fe-hydrogenase III small subunit